MAERATRRACSLAVPLKRFVCVAGAVACLVGCAGTKGVVQRGAVDDAQADSSVCGMLGDKAVYVTWQRDPLLQPAPLDFWVDVGDSGKSLGDTMVIRGVRFLAQGSLDSAERAFRACIDAYDKDRKKKRFAQKNKAVVWALYWLGQSRLSIVPTLMISCDTAQTRREMARLEAALVQADSAFDQTVRMDKEFTKAVARSQLWAGTVLCDRLEELSLGSVKGAVAEQRSVSRALVFDAFNRVMSRGIELDSATWSVYGLYLMGMQFANHAAELSRQPAPPGMGRESGWCTFVAGAMDTYYQKAQACLLRVIVPTCGNESRHDWCERATQMFVKFGYARGYLLETASKWPDYRRQGPKSGGGGLDSLNIGDARAKVQLAIASYENALDVAQRYAGYMGMWTEKIRDRIAALRGE